MTRREHRLGREGRPRHGETLQSCPYRNLLPPAGPLRSTVGPAGLVPPISLRDQGHPHLIRRPPGLQGFLGGGPQTTQVEVGDERTPQSGSKNPVQGVPELGKRHAPQPISAAGMRSSGTVSGTTAPSATAIRSDTSRRTNHSGIPSAPVIASSSSEEASFWPRSTSER